jgi:hypothetical protein
VGVLEDGTNILSRNVGKELPLYSNKYSKIVQNTVTLCCNIVSHHYHAMKGGIF